MTAAVYSTCDVVCFISSSPVSRDHCRRIQDDYDTVRSFVCAHVVLSYTTRQCVSFVASLRSMSFECCVLLGRSGQGSKAYDLGIMV